LPTITFPQFLTDYASELRYSYPTGHWFAIETADGKHIGNCSFYNISEIEGEAELGIMIGNRDHWDKGYGTDVISAQLCFPADKPQADLPEDAGVKQPSAEMLSKMRIHSLSALG